MWNKSSPSRCLKCIWNTRKQHDTAFIYLQPASSPSLFVSSLSLESISHLSTSKLTVTPLFIIHLHELSSSFLFSSNYSGFSLQAKRFYCFPLNHHHPVPIFARNFSLYLHSTVKLKVLLSLTITVDEWLTQNCLLAQRTEAGNFLIPQSF